MKPQDFADVYAFELARAEGRPTPRNPENFQAQFARERDEVQQMFDDLVEDRENILLGDVWTQRIFRPMDLGKFVVGRSRPHLFAQLSVEENRDFLNPERVTSRQRVIRMFAEGADTEPTTGGWSFVPYRTNTPDFIAGKLSLNESRRRALPSTVAMVKEFKDTLGHIAAAHVLEAPEPITA